MATDKVITRILQSFLLVYPLTQVDQDSGSLDVLREVWRGVLADVDDGALQAAATEYLRSPSEWRPPPGKLRQRALELAGASLEDRAFEAWQQCADIEDETMMRLARKGSDQIAVEAIRRMRMNMRRLREDVDGLEVMAERQRCFCAAYRELASRCDALALGSGPQAHGLGAGNG